MWKRKIIDEIIDNKIYDYLPDELILLNSEIEQAIIEEWPKENDDYATMLLDDKASYRYSFLHSVMKNINSRANKDNVLKTILEFARKKLDENS